ncbi:MAG: DUF2723 domain-containing protein, partial [Armatimonadetes bacterium]|nr:DUF2723 domain-containing protein [Armatimonadota bacterium]
MFHPRSRCRASPAERSCPWARRGSCCVRDRRDGQIATLLGLGFLGLYVVTLCPTVYLGDSGEICTAIASGGVVHPPGYPLFSLLGRLAVLFLPWGEPAFRIGCITAAAAALAVSFLFRCARELNAPRWLAVLGAAYLGTGFTFWSQSVRVEVYSLHLCLALFTLWCALRFRRTSDPEQLRAMALGLSLGLAHHLTIVLLIPALILLCWSPWRRMPQPARLLARAAPLLLFGPLLYGLLLRWAQQEPLQSWGHPVTLPLLWSHASARLYQGVFLRIPDGEQWRSGTAAGLAAVLDLFPPPLLAAALAGFLVQGRRDRTAALALSLTLLAVTAYNLCYRISDIAPYYLLVHAVLALGLIAAAGWVRDRVAVLRTPHPALRLALLLPIAWMAARNWTACDLSRATWVREFARQKLESSGPDAVLITQGD